MSSNKTITGKRLKQLRTDKDETQVDIAKILNSSRQIVSYYETGGRIPHVEDLVILANHFQTSVDYLLGLSDVKSIDAEVNAACEYTGLSEKAVEVLHYNSGQIDIFNSNMLAREISLLIEEYYEKQGTSNSLMHLIMGYPMGGFTVSDAASERVSRELDNFFSHHTAYTSTNDFQNILKTVYFEKLQKSFEKYKSFSRKEVINNGNDN